MKAGALAFVLATVLTVEERDAHRSNYEHPSAAVSANGRFVAFTTYSQLVTADTNHVRDVYVLDRARQMITLESGGTSSDVGDASCPRISGDGRIVVFERTNVVWGRDRTTGKTTPMGEGREPSVTEDGRTVLFTAGTSDRLPGTDANGDYSDIYAVDLESGRTNRVSIDLPKPSMSASVNPSASGDGRYVAFTTRIQTPGRMARDPHIFVRDTVLDVTKLIGPGWNPSLSGDGRLVAFVRLVDKIPHIFVEDLQTGASRNISKTERGALANGVSARPAISSDGRFVAFQSEASNLVVPLEDFNLLWDVFVFDRASGRIVRASGDPGEVWMSPSVGPSIDASGSVLTFSSRHPTDASDKRNDFDLYVITSSAATAANPSGWIQPFGALPGSPVLARDRVFWRAPVRGDRLPRVFGLTPKQAPFQG